MPERNKIYFVSDFHLGTPSYTDTREREQRILNWLDMVKANATELFLVGDVFDFWFEYATVVPKGYIRFLGKLAELADAGVKLWFFKGNHDMWVFSYFEQELNATIIDNEMIIERNGKKFFIHHGDGLAAGDHSYKLLKKVFRSNTCQWLFARIHPNLGVGIANYWSRHSRKSNQKKKDPRPAEAEWLVAYCRNHLDREYDYMIFGHSHLPVDYRLNDKTRYINLGEWLMYDYSYAVFDGKDVVLHYKERE